MRLYNLDLSNFASKCRIAIYEKQLTVELTPPPGGMSSLEFKKLILQLDNGRLIAESEIINEYLEETFPETPLLPKDVEGRARVRFLSRLNDLYPRSADPRAAAATVRQETRQQLGSK